MNRRALWWVVVGLCAFLIGHGLLMVNDFMGMPWSYEGAREDALRGMIAGCAFVFVGGWMLVAVGLLEPLMVRETEHKPEGGVL